MRNIKLKRSIIKIVMIMGIYQALCFPSYGCDHSYIEWEPTHVDGKPVYFGYKDVVVRPGQYILFKAELYRVVTDLCKVNFTFTKIDSQDETIYQETDRIRIGGIAQVGIHWKVDGKIVKPGRYLVEIQAPSQKVGLFKKECIEASNIVSREVVFDPGDTPEEFEVKDED